MWGAVAAPPCLLRGCLFGVVLWVFYCLAGFSVFFWCSFATILLLYSYCFARVVGGVGFRVFFGFLSVFGGVFIRGRLVPMIGGSFFRFFSWNELRIVLTDVFFFRIRSCVFPS